MEKEKVELIAGGQHEDARGVLRFCNDFDMSSVKRFYTISNSPKHLQRGWIMHKRETKWFFPLCGTTTVFVEPDSRAHGPSCAAAKTFVLSASEPVVLQILPRHWFLIEQDGTAEVQVFSNCFINEFPDDDFRHPVD